MSKGIELIGTIISEVVQVSDFGRGKVFSTNISIVRVSGVEDIITVVFSENACKIELLKVGKRLYVDGDIRHRKGDNGVQRHLTYVMASKMELLSIYDTSDDINDVEMECAICNVKEIRKTIKGRVLIDVLVAKNRKPNNSDYIHCIFWGNNAEYVSKKKPGDKIKIFGRLQSREYKKTLEMDHVQTFVVHEVSVADFVQLEESCE